MSVAEPERREHRWRIDAREYDRHEQRRGRRFAYETVDQRHTALVVVDMIPFFVDHNPYCRGVVPNINRLAGAVRAAGGHVAWVVPDAEAVASVWAIEFYGFTVGARYAESGGSGPIRERLWPALDVCDGDILAEKSAASAFFPGRSTLPDLLAERGATTVVIAGTVTNVCCESSARDASTLGYRVVMAADACAALDDESHNATLRTIYRSFGDVRPTDEVVVLMDSSPSVSGRAGDAPVSLA